MSQGFAVEFIVTLMQYDNSLEIHVQSGDKDFQYYFYVPAVMTQSDAELQAAVFAAARKMYDDLNAHFRLAEPSDMGYLLVKSTHARRLSEEELDAKIWRQARPPVWESTPCVVMREDGAYAKVSYELFESWLAF